MIAPKPEPKLNVLVADDESIARDILQIHLESIGCEVQSAVDGDHALHVLEDDHGNIGLVVLDAVMPGPCARELYDRVRAIDPDVPVLICSAHSLNHPDLRFISDEHLPFLPKPFTRLELLQTLSNLLTSAQAENCGMMRYPPPDPPRQPDTKGYARLPRPPAGKQEPPPRKAKPARAKRRSPRKRS